MSKSVLDTIERYARHPQKRESLDTHAVELELCDFLVQMRQEAGLTQEQLARKLDCSQAFIAKLENGGYDRAGIGTLRRFALALGYDIDIAGMFKPRAASFWPSYPSNAVQLVYQVHDGASHEPIAALEQAKHEIFREKTAA